MKTRRQKVVLKYMSIFTCILLCASFFCIPVSAGSMYDVTFETPIPGEEGVFRVGGGRYDDWSPTEDLTWQELSMPKSVEDVVDTDGRPGTAYTFDWIDANQGVLSFWLGQSTFGIDRFQTSDYAWLDQGAFTLEVVEGDYIAFSYYRFVLRPHFVDGTVGAVIASTEPTQFYLSGIGQDYVRVSYPKLSFNFYDSVSAKGLVLCLEVAGSSLNNFNQIIATYQDYYSVHYAKGSDPNYPIYGGADSGNLDELESQEQQLMDSASGGIDAGINAMVGFQQIYNDLNLFVFPMRLAAILNGLVDIPGIHGLVMVSLSLGLFASLMALAGSLVSAADRKAGQAKREAAAAERAAKREKYYASRKNK